MIKNLQNFIFLILTVSLLMSCSVPIVSQKGIESPTPKSGNQAKSVESLPVVASTAKNPSISFSTNLSCWDVKLLDKEQNIPGGLFFSDYSKNSFVWDINSFHIHTIETASGFSVSSNGTSIFGSNTSISRFIQTTPNDTRNFQLPEDDYIDPQYLVDGRIQLRVLDTKFDPYNYSGSGITDKFIVIDPVTGNIETYAEFLPQFWLTIPPYYAIQYSPNLHYVVYQTKPGNEGQHRFILLDIINNKFIWIGPKVDPNMIGNLLGMPTWLPDSSGLVYSYDNGNQGENFYFMSLSGDVTKLTDFDKVAISGVDSTKGRQALIPSWSPDGRYMAFRVKQNNQDSSDSSLSVTPSVSMPLNQTDLYILDMQKKLVFKPCLPEEESIVTSYKVIWSYDSEHLVIQTIHKDGKRSSEMSSLPSHANTVILDLSRKIIFKLPDEKDRGEYSVFAGEQFLTLIGWVNWGVR